MTEAKKYKLDPARVSEDLVRKQVKQLGHSKEQPKKPFIGRVGQPESREKPLDQYGGKETLEELKEGQCGYAALALPSYDAMIEEGHELATL